MENEIKVNKEKVLEIWNNSFSIVERLQPFIEKPPEFYYNSGVCDVCRLILGDKDAK